MPITHSLRRSARSVRRVLTNKLSAFLIADGKLTAPARLLSRRFQDDVLFSHYVSKWFRDDGDSTLRLNYPELNEGSLVLDLGGYKGQFASDIFGRYRCEVYVFEPFSAFVGPLLARFVANPRIRVFDFGLGAVDELRTIFYQDDATSVFRHGTRHERVRIQSFGRFLTDNRLETIDLLKINIEGSEYDLLEHIIRSNLQTKICNIQVQFHRDIENAFERMSAIQARLIETHYLTYNYPFVWQNYRLR